jgi:hypothetical protein
MVMQQAQHLVDLVIQQLAAYMALVVSDTVSMTLVLVVDQ